MTPNFNPHNENQQPPSGFPETIQRDRFELLSAYLDGEVTAIERRQIEDWLVNDPAIQRLHSRLLKLRHGLQALPVPPVEESSIQQTIDHVFARVERRSKLRLVWGGAAAIAAVFVGALVSGILPGSQILTPQLVRSPGQDTQISHNSPDSELLLIALEKPLVDIPKAPVATEALPSDTELQPQLSGEGQ
jgi:anti-sigma factor RsiW